MPQRTSTHPATLDELLRAAKLSDRAVQRGTGVAPLTLRNIRAGAIHRPSFSVCDRLARLLGLSAADVLSAAVFSIALARSRRTAAL
jgi:hypothetical protein